MGIIRFIATIASSTLLLTSAALAEVKTESFDYKQGETTLEGFIAYDDAQTGKRPGVLIFPQWTGLSDHERNVAREMAKLGYVAMVADVYGKGVRPAPPKDSGAEMGKYMSNRPLLRSRVKAGFETLSQRANVNASKIAVIGYCFGGTAALEAGRDGVPAAAFVSLHGVLSNPTPADAKNFKAPVLVLHGADDAVVSAKEVETFQAEMKEAKADLQFISYSGAPHGFTQAGNYFNARAAARSWVAMQDLFKETLAQ
jgi:dienelactone hydrolase